MATLQPGEKARMYALGKIARGGATRGGYVSARAFIAIDGIQIGFGGTPGAGHVGVLIDSLSITDALNEAANTCRFRVNGMVPAAGAEVKITLGSKNATGALFAGFALAVQQGYAADKPANINADVSAVDYTWLFGFVTVTKAYRAQSADAIAADLVATYAAANGFTAHGVAPFLPMIDQITFTNEALDQALTRLAQRIGAYWYVDYQKDVHVFVDETRNGAPETLTPQHPSLADVRKAADRTQVLTRVYVEGRGSSILGAVAAGDTLIPVEAIDMFEAAPDVFAKISPHGSEGAAEWVSFTGVVPGGAGSLIGPGGGPPGAPALALSATAGSLAPGRYQYAYTDKTPTGETLPSPLATITIGVVVIPAPPTVAAALLAQVAPSGGVTMGSHQYTYTYMTAAGAESLGGPASAIVQTQATVLTNGYGIDTATAQAGGSLASGDWGYDVTFIGTLAGETEGASARRVTITTARSVALTINVPAGVAQVKVYRTPLNLTGGYFLIGTATLAPDRTTATFTDTGLTGGAAIPVQNTATAALQQIRVVTTATADATVTGVKLYRKNVGLGTAYKLVGQVDGAKGAVTYYDTKPDGSLGTAAPPTTTPTTVTAVAISNVAPGPAPTNARKVYRTGADGSALKLLTTLSDNTTTALTDLAADASLGAAPPTSDTSGLQNQTAGQVGAGATTVPVGTAAPFEAAGGWAVIGNGEQVIRYTGKTAQSLTGIPPIGIGAIVAGIAYNSTITAAPMLTGIPAAGTLAILEDLNAGDEINLVVKREDAARQTTLAAMIKTGPGWREEWVQDRRLAIPEARARGDATLALRPLEDVTITYTCRDLRTASGKTITVNLPAPTNLSGTYKIQTVTIGKFRPFPTQYPTFSVTASSSRFSFEDWLRQLQTKV
jgi:hypothetical protein